MAETAASHVTSRDEVVGEPLALYSPGQRAVALLWGLLCHSTFLVAIAAMAIGLFTGMNLGRSSLQGGWALLANLALIIQFGVLHSVLLSAPGRSWMARLPLAGVGSELSTTSFALFSSLQILAVFLLWSPGGNDWFAPQGALLVGWTVIYSISWLLLLKAMWDSGLGLQTGALGWLAVWKNRRPVFPGYSMRGLYRISRQPIYVAFALILWTAPAWTLDHLVIACLWTAYCMLGPIFKERRFLRFYGDGYRKFASTVPYWLPFFGRHTRFRTGTPAPEPETDFDVIISGAGPVGMVLANLLGRDRLRVLVIERRVQRSERSRAIGVTAPTLKILDRIGILHSSLNAAMKIGEVDVYGDDGRSLGGLSFRQLVSSCYSVVSLPQRSLETLLERSMMARDTVTYWTGREVTSHRDEHGEVKVQVACGESGQQQVSARWLVACDGGSSLLREQLRMPTRRKVYRCRFAMADFEDRSNIGEGVRLFFTRDGAVETFPLPGGWRRWVVQLTQPEEEPHDDSELLGAIKRRAVWAPSAADRKGAWSTFVPQRLLCDRFFHGRTLICGDAAHLMSPIGGQGMNVGIGDALAAYSCLRKLLNSDEPHALHLLRNFDRCRRKAFTKASRLAAMGMWMGTRTGIFSSSIRAIVLKKVLSSTTLRRRIANHYAMIEELKQQAITVSSSSGVSDLSTRIEPPATAIQ